MPSQELKSLACLAWKEYGDAITAAFRWTPGSFADPGILERQLQGTDESLTRFIDYVKEQTREISEMKFLGED